MMSVFLIIIGILLMAFSYRSISKPGNIASKKTINEKLDSLNEKIDSLHLEMQKADTIAPEEDVLSFQKSKETIEEDSPAREDKDTRDTTFENLVHTELSKDINEQIYDDYNKGLSVNELASKYKKGKGEVELRLNLKK